MGRTTESEVLTMARILAAKILKRPTLVITVISFALGAPAALAAPNFSLMYDRGTWKHWTDEDGDCRNTRAELLIDRSIGKIIYSSYKKCAVKGGAWMDFYTGIKLTEAKDVDIDHIVALKFAHGHGGDQWPSAKKRAFANDPLNLAITAKKINRSKGDKGPDEWRPPNPGLVCSYAQSFRKVANKYGLKLIPTETAALMSQLKSCATRLRDR